MSARVSPRTQAYARGRACVCLCACLFEAFVSVLLPFIFLSGWLNTHMPVV